MKASVLSVGAMYIDINAQQFPFEEGLRPHTETVGKEYEAVAGGSALNFARICVSLGLTSVFVGKAGADVLGEVLAKLVSLSGVTPAFIQSNEVETNIGMNFVRDDGASIMTVVGSANQSLQGEEVLERMRPYLPEVSYVYFGGCFKLKSLLPFYIQLAESARKAGAKVVLDHGRITNALMEEEKNMIKDLLPSVSFYLPSKDEFLSLWNTSTVEEGLATVRRTSAAVVVVKNAENGAVGFADKEMVHVPSFSVKVLNTVGAGDSFNAGFIKAQELQLEFEESIRFACATAAVMISENGVPTVSKVNQLLEGA